MTEPLSLTGKRWLLTEQGETNQAWDDPVVLLEQLRQGRGLIGEETLHALDASAFPEASIASERVRHAMKKGEKIGIFGDYDCDGITATVQLVRFFRRHGTEPFVRLPHRVHDGYGLRVNTVDLFHANGVTLLITVDTGITAREALDRAKEVGIDVIILDHHHVPQEKPPAYAILHPILAKMPLPHPCAAGIVFAFLHELEGGMWAERETDLVLAMFGTIADLVPLLGRNRILVRQGLAALPRIKEGPIAALLASIQTEGKALTSTDIAFRVAPRLNAAGRMADPIIALEALLEGGNALELLDELNQYRQQETRRLWADIFKTHHTSPIPLPPFLTIANTDYAPGIIGLLAGKLLDAFGRPSMAVHINGDMCSASLRSPACYNIVQALERHAHLLASYGGHAQAAGCTFTLAILPSLQEALEEDTRQRTQPEELLPSLSIDAELKTQSLSFTLCERLETLGPFGQANAEPLFLLRDVQLSNLRCVGSEQQHLQAYLGQAKVIGFHLGSHAGSALQPLDIVCRIGMDEWNGRRSVQLQMVDLRPAVYVHEMKHMTTNG